MEHTKSSHHADKSRHTKQPRQPRQPKHRGSGKHGVTMRRVVEAVNHGLAFVQDACRKSTLTTAKSVASQIDEVALKMSARCPEVSTHPLVPVVLNDGHVGALDAARVNNPHLYAALHAAAVKAHKKLASLKPAQVAAYYEKVGSQLLLRRS